MPVADGLIALVVEDDDFQRRTVVRMLRSLGTREAREAKDGKQALAAFAGAAPVDLVVCDLDMPEMDGMEFLRHLGQAHSAVSVIIASAQDRSLLTSVDKMARAYGVRLLGTIEKPVTLEGLENLIALHEPLKPQRVRAAADAPSFSLDQVLEGVREKQFEPFFQPKVGLATGRIVGAEALARWHHPEHGLLAPDAFMAPLERSGNSGALTLLMLETAAGACRAWREHGFELTVSANLSLVSLTDTMLADQITQTVHSAGLDSRCMILEITETTAMTELAPALENLARLRMRGFGLSVDDYGNGAASLQQLMRVPFTELKIDEGFVKGCAANSSSRAIVESSVQMARRLDIKSVALGVETQVDWGVLKAAGCDQAQGNFVAKPMQQSAFLGFCATEAASRTSSLRSAWASSIRR
jgi:EAL domain-containing protein (putative c-di-GMP-specific phosphodiesterase class I)/AmiR/NasT family two-component response regulator